MKNKERKCHGLTVVFVVLYIAFAVCLFLFHPFVASAAETDTEKKESVPGGKGNIVRIYNVHGFVGTGNWAKEDRTIKMKNDVEMIGYIDTYTDSDEVVHTKVIRFLFCKDNVYHNSYSSNLVDDYVGVHMEYSKDTLKISWAYSDPNILNPAYYYYGGSETRTVKDCTITGMKIFSDIDAARAYAETGSLDGMIREELDTSWYLKDLGYKVTADDSPSGSGGEDATYITFTWLTDNLQDGDLLEIKTRNYYKKIGGDQVYGFHDYITFNDNVSCLDGMLTDGNGNERGSYTLGQYDATKAWYSTLEDKPLIFKSYETEIYYLRPYRNGKFGKWCKVTMKRFGDSGSPYIEKVEIGDLDDEGEWEQDEDLTEENGGEYGLDQGGNVVTPDPDNPFEGTNIAGIFTYMFDFFKSIPSLLGDLPALVNSTIGFLPLPVIGFIAVGIAIAIILRIVGR